MTQTYETEAPAGSMSWRQEARQDRLVRAQIEREQEAARVQARIAEREANERVRQAASEARRAARTEARADRTARRGALAAWVAGHVTDLLFVPVIGVPAALAWSAMAEYGARLYPVVGYLLPAFSEGAMWAFAASVTLTLRRHPGHPVWHLRTGIALFAMFGAVLNFLHGYEAGGVVEGIVMALVSIAGVTAHQLVTAGPRRARAERNDARIDRAAARRERRARRAALRGTVADMDSRGRARLVYQSGPAMLERHFGRTRLVPVEPEPRPMLALPAAPADVPDDPETADENAPAVPSQGDVLTSLADSLERIVAALVTADATAEEDAPATVSDTASDGGHEDPALTEIPAVPESAEAAALAGMEASVAGGKPYTVNGLQTRYRLTRTEAIKLRNLVMSANGHDGPASGRPAEPANEAQRRVWAWEDTHDTTLHANGHDVLYGIGDANL